MLDFAGAIASLATTATGGVYVYLFVMRRYKDALVTVSLTVAFAILGLVATLFDPNDDAANVALDAFNVFVWSTCMVLCWRSVQKLR